jgi:type IV fimbrial biogenesis protein FimT
MNPLTSSPVWPGRNRSGHGDSTASGGFTLTELLVAITILAVLIALAAPSFVEAIRNRRLDSQIGQLVYSLNVTRSEAVKRNSPTTICKSANGSACATSGEWQQGWIVFVDANGNQVFDGSPEEIIHITQALLPGFTLRASTNVVNAVSFDAKGVSTTAGVFVLCADGQINRARLVEVNLAGRIRQGADSDRDGIPEKADGSEITSCTP